jgi:nucleotidyltransferase/DNA polymerase involved in DNA repair
MSVLYCTIPHFAVALARRDGSGSNHSASRGAERDCPLVLVDPEGRVFDASPEAAACGVSAGLTARMARIRCPQARLEEADVVHCRQEMEALLQLLECTGPSLEPHGWGAAYVDLGDLARNRTEATALCAEMGRSIRHELGEDLQPALGWDSSKFTAQAAARRTRPGRLLAVSSARERAFLTPLPVTLLPLGEDAQRRLGFLGLRTLGQYAALPPAAVWQQFGHAGRLAHRCARGEDDRPIIPRHRATGLSAEREFEVPLVAQERIQVALRSAVSSLLSELWETLRACGHLCLTLRYDDGSAETCTRTLIFPTADETTIVRALDQLLEKMSWPAPATGLSVVLEQIQDVMFEQLSLFVSESEQERRRNLRRNLREVQRYLVTRFGANCLRRAALVQPGAPLPEWRVGWIEGDEVASDRDPT